MKISKIILIILGLGITMYSQVVQKKFYLANDGAYKKLVEVVDRPWVSNKANVLDLITLFHGTGDFPLAQLDSVATRLKFVEMLSLWNNNVSYYLRTRPWSAQAVQIFFEDYPGSFTNPSSDAGAAGLAVEHNYGDDYRS